jgi:hypothetical protein
MPALSSFFSPITAPPSAINSKSRPTDWSEADLHERFGALNALRPPAPCRTLTVPDLTLVDTFPLVFACLTGSDSHGICRRVSSSRPMTTARISDTLSNTRPIYSSRFRALSKKGELTYARQIAVRKLQRLH